MDFVRRLVGSKPKKKQAPPRADTSQKRSVDEATVFRPVPNIEADSDPLGESASRGRPDQLTMMGVSPVDEAQPSGNTGTQPDVVVLDSEDSEAATVYMEIPSVPEPEAEPEVEPEPAPRRQVATLTAVDGELSGQVFAVLEGDNQLGRAPDSDLVLASKFVSRVHARLVCTERKITFVPVSDQLTLINGDAATERELQDGDEVQIGRTKLQVRIEG
jgi:hypothetical protein